jgi:hypothetical protein
VAGPQLESSARRRPGEDLHPHRVGGGPFGHGEVPAACDAGLKSGEYQDAKHSGSA